jgi:hypothetical protein
MATFYSPRIVTDGLLFHFDPGNSRSYPGSGTVWRDLGPNRYTASLINNPVFNSANGGALGLDGAWARLDFPSPITLSTYTHDYWVYKYGYAGGYNTIVDFGNDRNAVMTNNNSILHFNPSIFANYTISTTAPSWTNIIVSHAFGGPFYFYINGQLTLTSGNNSTVHSNVPSAGIGGGITGATTIDEAWSGRAGIIKFYLNKALTAEEVRQNYNATKGRYGLL